MILERIVGSCLKVSKAPTCGGLALHLHKIGVDGKPIGVLTKRDQRACENRECQEICGQNHGEQSDRVGLILIQKYTIGKPLWIVFEMKAPTSR